MMHLVTDSASMLREAIRRRFGIFVVPLTASARSDCWLTGEELHGYLLPTIAQVGRREWSGRGARQVCVSSC